ncbi:MAG: hypothetical protein U1E76_15580 [Planctomycetota bacterium]
MAPARVAQARDLLAGSSAIVISIAGFPLGSATTATKAAEASEVVRLGAREVDMVLNVGALKEGDDAYGARPACGGERPAARRSR